MENIEEVFGTKSLFKIIFVPNLTPLKGNGYEWNKSNKVSKSNNM